MSRRKIKILPAYFLTPHGVQAMDTSLRSSARQLPRALEGCGLRVTLEGESGACGKHRGGSECDPWILAREAEHVQVCVHIALDAVLLRFL